MPRLRGQSFPLCYMHVTGELLFGLEMSAIPTGTIGSPHPIGLELWNGDCTLLWRRALLRL